jgi:predicted AAA+ superfamily ATPase
MNVEKKPEAILILDEIQRITDWSAIVKKHWDRDARERVNIKLVLLGSSRMLIMDGLSESLMGRFELLYAGHWSFTEMKKAFGFSVDQYAWFGGFPGAAALVTDETRFKEYIRNVIIEPTMSRDILMTTKIDKPALLRQLFEVGIGYSSKIMSYNRMLGQLQDAGNTTTLAKYLTLLDQAGLLVGLNKYSGRLIETKGTIPKFQTQNTALLSGMSPLTYDDVIFDPVKWGEITENAVGMHLINQIKTYPNASMYYWRENNMEVDYVVTFGKRAIGIEVKSGHEGIPQKTSEKFAAIFPKAKLLLVGPNGISLEVFLKTTLSDLFDV